MHKNFFVEKAYFKVFMYTYSCVVVIVITKNTSKIFFLKFFLAKS